MINSNEMTTISTRPWIRFLARYFDFIIHSLVIVVIWYLIDEESIETINDHLFNFILMVVWVVLDGIYMSTFGTTPSKKLLKIQVRTQSGNKISKYVAFKRSRLVWLRGMGLGIGLIGIIANILAYRRLKRVGSTSWDSDLNLEVTHGNIGIVRILLCFIIVFGILLIGISEIL
jgi:hypothetical protein